MFYKECGILTYSQKRKNNKKKACLPTKRIEDHMNSFKRVRAFQIELEFGSVGSWGERKTSRSKGENQQQTQPTYGVNAGIWTRATLVGDERSHHCSTLAPLLTYFGPEKETPLGRGLRVPV